MMSIPSTLPSVSDAEALMHSLEEAERVEREASLALSRSLQESMRLADELLATLRA